MDAKLIPLHFSLVNKNFLEQIEHIKRELDIGLNTDQSIIMDEEGNSFFYGHVLNAIRFYRAHKQKNDVNANHRFLCANGKIKSIRELAKLKDKKLTSDYFFKNIVLLHFFIPSTFEIIKKLSFSVNSVECFSVVYKKQKEKNFYMGFIDNDSMQPFVPDPQELSFIRPNYAAITFMKGLLKNNSNKITLSLAREKIQILEDFLFKLILRDNILPAMPMLQTLYSLGFVIVGALALEEAYFLALTFSLLPILAPWLASPAGLLFVGVGLAVGFIGIMLAVLTAYYSHQAENMKKALKVSSLDAQAREFKVFVQDNLYTTFGNYKADRPMNNYIEEKEEAMITSDSAKTLEGGRCNRNYHFSFQSP